MPLLVGGVVVLLLAVLLGYLMFSAKGRYAENVMGLDSSKNRLNKLSGRAVFPSEANVQAIQRQLGVYDGYLDGLFDSMRAGQRASEGEMGRDQFRQLLEQTLGRLLNLAKSKSIAIPPDFSFGFQRYTSGILPAEDELGRLVDQFHSLTALCEVLYEAGISELVSVERTVFEKDALTAIETQDGDRGRGRGGRGRGEPEPEVRSTELVRDPDGLFTKERYVVTYRAQDAVNWKVFDLLSKGAPFVIVTKVEITNSARPVVVPPRAETPAPPPPGGRPAPAGGGVGAAPGSAPEILPRELRVVAGQELPLVRLEVEMYRFAADESAAGKGEVNP